MKLKRSMDRKVTNAVSKNGKTPTIANTFGLPSGKAYSCPGETSVCSKVCYAGKLERVYKGVREVLLHACLVTKLLSLKGFQALTTCRWQRRMLQCKTQARSLAVPWGIRNLSEESPQI